ncbi:MAG TPA: hypothetical protein ENO00_00740 [Deltaproteobacteria bacterium]|nr:hypothetical protein [Deltaproteobacteria bacterium]
MDEDCTKKKKKNELQAAGWEVIYCSLALILVAFFAMLVSYSKVEGNQMINFLRGFGGASETGRTSSVSQSSPVLNAYDSGVRGSGKPDSMAQRDISDPADDAAMPGADEVKNIAAATTGGKHAIEDERILRALESLYGVNEKKIALSMDYLAAYFERMGLRDEVDITKTRDGFKATITSGILFPSGSATISEKVHQSLDKIITLVNAVPYMVRIEGHTDNVPIHTETYPSNWELSTARAVNVLRYFLDKGGVSPARIAAVGFGEYHPIAANATPEERKKNRRVDFYFEFVDTTESLSQRGMN